MPSTQTRRDDVDTLIYNGGFPDTVVIAACKGHWSSWGRMRPDVERKWKQKMQAALLAAEKERAALKRLVELVDAADNQWSRGYYCAVSVLLREEGCATAEVRGLFAQGGDAMLADPEDIELFRQHGLMA